MPVCCSVFARPASATASTVMTQHLPTRLPVLPRRILLTAQELPPPTSPGSIALYALVSVVLVLGSGLASGGAVACATTASARQGIQQQGLQPPSGWAEVLAKEATQYLVHIRLQMGRHDLHLYLNAYCMTGLTLGLMSLDTLEIKVLSRSGTPKEQKLAASILPVLQDPHWLLVTLLLWNAACFEALPIFLDVLVDPLGAILISATLILLFGEILPQAVCARHGLRIGVALSPLVRFMMYLFFPIAWPLARCLDWLLGKEGYTIYGRKQLKALVDLHGADEGLGGKLSDDEVQIICGALDLTNKVAFSAMTPLDKVVMLSTEQRIDAPTIATIMASGHSRLPVYIGDTRTHIKGLLLVKELLKVVPLTGVDAVASAINPPRVADIQLRPLPRLPANTPMYALLKLFQTGRAHMVLLTQPEPSAPEQDAATAPFAADTLPCNKPKERLSQYAGHAMLPTCSPNEPAQSAADGHEEVQTAPQHYGMNKDRSTPSYPSGSTQAVQLCCMQPGTASQQAKSRHATDRQHAQAPATAYDGPSTAEQAALPAPADNQPTAIRQATLPVTVQTAPGVCDEPLTSQRALQSEEPEDKDACRDNQRGTPTVQGITAAVVRGLSTLPAAVGLQRGSTQSQPVSSISMTAPAVPAIAVPGEPIGIITIEDVLEELMYQEILDESDTYADNERTITVDEVRQQMAQRLPEPLRNLVLGTAASVMRPSASTFKSSTATDRLTALQA